jgi:hypothetical protein
MFGANYYGGVYYSQASPKFFILNLRTLSASVTTVAKLTKLVGITRKATAVITIATLAAPYQKALSRLTNAVTKALNFTRTTRRIQ